MSSGLEIWDKVWAGATDDSDFCLWVRREAQGVRGRKIVAYLNKYLGGISGLKTVEVGSGSGVYSFIFASRGASVTLMDYSQAALLLSEKYFKSYGVAGSFIHQDVFSLDARHKGEFDLAMSFGVVEHFEGSERLLMAKVHLDLVRPGGVVIVSVPNSWFFPHEILNFILHRRNEWPLGYEKSFSRKELFRSAKQMGLENIKICGSAFFTDFCRYIGIFQNTRFFQRFYKVRTKDGFVRDLASFFDNLFGADIFLMGRKPFLKE